MIYPWGTERRINAYSDYFRNLYGTRVQKISVDAGFTCPNRDGSCATGGCTFCNNDAFTPAYNEADRSIAWQISQGMEFHRSRYRKATKFLAYFQSYTNTYADLDSLKELYQQALELPDIMGIVVGTRPDCVDAEKLDYFAQLSKKYHVVLEYGLESLRDETLERVNRGHSVEKSAWAVRETARRGIRTGGHMIIGLPGETRDDTLEMARELSTWPLNNIKYHQLQVIHGTALAREYKEHPEDFPEFSMEEYLELMMELISHLNPAFVLERIAGEVMPGMAVRDGWGVRYDEVLKRFEALLEQHDVWQGKNFKTEEE